MSTWDECFEVRTSAVQKLMKFLGKGLASFSDPDQKTNRSTLIHFFITWELLESY